MSHDGLLPLPHVTVVRLKTQKKAPDIFLEGKMCGSKSDGRKPFMPLQFKASLFHFKPHSLSALTKLVGEWVIKDDLRIFFPLSR